MTKNYELDLRDLYECEHRPEIPVVDDSGNVTHWVCRCGRQHPVPQKEVTDGH
jgi:hypothetical protein